MALINIFISFTQRIYANLQKRSFNIIKIFPGTFHAFHVIHLARRSGERILMSRVKLVKAFEAFNFCLIGPESIFSPPAKYRAGN